MKKYLNYLYNTGLLMWGIAILWTLIATGSIHVSKCQPGFYCALFGTFLWTPKYIYEFWHFKEYKKENIGCICFLVIMAIVAIAIVVFGK
ncbi:MAG: hypothetical protein IKH14_02155 [Prevotella sp.]|nr:hypothetical protein [Prevotella sp.]MBR1654945.1 hypothetical protein [Prevotella sp.]MBR3389979.1 hypothetical protein [Prevotella sp.]MBR3444657.1 hypothetical protein [Prevotella sp.]